MSGNQIVTTGEPQRRPAVELPKSAPIGLVALLGAVSLCFGDQIEVRDGKPVTGKIDRETATEVTIETPNGSVAVPVNRVMDIRYDGQGPVMTQAEILYDAYSLARAAEEYDKALRGVTDKPLIARAAQFGHARALAQLALDQSIGIDEAIARLEHFAREHPQSRHHFPLYELLGRLQIAKKQYAQASAAFDELAKAPWPELKSLASLYQARMLLAENKPDLAAARIDQILASGFEGAGYNLIQAQALIEKSRCFQGLGLREQEIAALEQAIARAPSTAIAVQAEAHTALGDAYRAAGRRKPALFAFLHVDLLFAKDKELHARALYNLTELWSELGQTDRAAAARATLKTEYPDNVWSQKL